MNTTRTEDEVFQDFLVTDYSGDETRKEMRIKCTAAGLFDHDPGLQKAEDSYKDRKIQQLARKRGWIDRNGDPLELVNVVRKDKKTGKRTHSYVDLNLASVDDGVYLVENRLASAKHLTEEAGRFYSFFSGKYGRKFQKLLQFEVPIKSEAASPSAN